MKKKEYIIPVTKVVEVLQHHYLLSGSRGAKTFQDTTDEGWKWQDDGLDGDDC